MEQYPAKCPITGRPFFMDLIDEQGNTVPTYGGPYDSYTIPVKDDDGNYTTERYDHDLGGWRGAETIYAEEVGKPSAKQPLLSSGEEASAEKAFKTRFLISADEPGSEEQFQYYAQGFDDGKACQLSSVDNDPELPCYDLSGCSQDDKQIVAAGALQASAKMLLTTFLSLGLKDYLETGVINEATRIEYRLSFKRKGYVHPDENENWISVKERPLYTEVASGWECTEDGNKEFIAAIPYEDAITPGKTLWWIRHCCIEDIMGLCVVGDDDNVPAGWSHTSITHWRPWPSNPGKT